MKTTDTTPGEIAREAANELFRNVGCLPGRREQAAAIILTAARRIAEQMVRDSGAVEALEAIAQRLTESEERGRPALVAVNYAKMDAARAALEKLRALTT